jgi:hypothetical protein
MSLPCPSAFDQHEREVFPSTVNLSAPAMVWWGVERFRRRTACTSRLPVSAQSKNSPWAAEEIEHMKRRLMSGTIVSLSMCDWAILANATYAAATRRAAGPITRRVAQGL